MAALAADPPAAQVPAAGGASTHNLVNSGASRLAFKVKSSNNNEYRLKPVFGFVVTCFSTNYCFFISNF
uniref:MSP domain-containing protein n=1 Tax=Panagrolaimus sp. JU765 TaxID=591449 RepID=A0AC34RPU5_9BILA